MRLSFTILVLFLLEFAEAWHISLETFQQIARSKRQYGLEAGDSTSYSSEISVIDLVDGKSTSGE